MVLNLFSFIGNSQRVSEQENILSKSYSQCPTSEKAASALCHVPWCVCHRSRLSDLSFHLTLTLCLSMYSVIFSPTIELHKVSMQVFLFLPHFLLFLTGNKDRILYINEDWCNIQYTYASVSIVSFFSAFPWYANTKHKNAKAGHRIKISKYSPPFQTCLLPQSTNCLVPLPLIITASWAVWLGVSCNFLQQLSQRHLNSRRLVPSASCWPQICASLKSG